MRLLIIAASVTFLGCNATRQIANNAPAAQTPVVTRVGTVMGAGPHVQGKNAELLPARVVQLRLLAPYPSELVINLDGNIIEKRTSPVEPANIGNGYYTVDHVNIDEQPAVWIVTVRAPQSFVNRTGYYIDIQNRSINPNMTGTDRLSQKTDVKLTTKALPPAPPPKKVTIQLFKGASSCPTTPSYVLDNDAAFANVPANAVVDFVINNHNFPVWVAHGAGNDAPGAYLYMEGASSNVGLAIDNAGFGDMAVRGKWVMCLVNKPGPAEEPGLLELTIHFK